MRNVPGDNNPRVFAKAIGLDVWRTKFDGQHATANLYIDAVFHPETPVGRHDDPVRFRLSLKKAEIYVVQDHAKVVKIISSSVYRQKRPEISSSQSDEESKGSHFEGDGRASLSDRKLDLSGAAEKRKSTMSTKKIDVQQELQPINILRSKTDNGYRFVLSPSLGDRLVGESFDIEVPAMRIKDSKPHRKRGEVPELLVEIRCLVEDLIIEDIKFVGASYPIWSKLTRPRQMVVEQYIKSELMAIGLKEAEFDDEFSEVLLGDAIARES